MGNLILQENNHRHQIQKSFNWKHEHFQSSYQVVFDNNHLIKGQRYFVSCQGDKQYAKYIFRKENPLYIVAVIDIDSPPTIPNLCYNPTITSVVLQRVVSRYLNLKSTSFSQAIEIMEKALKGAAILYEQAGAILYNQAMICFNQNSQTKIWLNQNLQLNYPLNQNQCVTITESIQSIFTTIQSKISEIPLQYYQRKAKEPLNSFQSALQFVLHVRNIQKQAKFARFSQQSTIQRNRFLRDQKGLNIRKLSPPFQNSIRRHQQVVDFIPIKPLQNILHRKVIRNTDNSNNRSLGHAIPQKVQQLKPITTPFAKKFQEQPIHNQLNIKQGKNVHQRVLQAINRPLVFEKFNDQISKLKEIPFLPDHTDYQRFKLDQSLDYEKLRQKIISMYL